MRLATVLAILFAPPFLSIGVVRAQSSDDEERLDRAITLIRDGELDEAEAMLREVNAADHNYWRAMYGLAPGHWVAEDYLAVIERMRAGDDSDEFFASEHFRFHLRGLQLDASERERVARSFEDILARVARWADEREWLAADGRLIFVVIAERFPTPSPARSLIFFWDRQDRAPRMEVTRRVLDPRFLDPIVAHELTHVVLPHTNRPLAEGMANLAAREIFPEKPNPIRGRLPPDAEPWPLDEVLLFNVRAEGAKAKRQVELLGSGGFSREAIGLISLMYEHGDDLVGMILERWGKARLMEVYRATNRDPAAADILAIFELQLVPLGELRRAWSEWLGE